MPGAERRRLDRYELLAEIARGGMGMVLLARIAGAGGFQRLFAVKVMHPHLVENPEFVAMLLDEARLAARIHHPNVVATVDVRTHGNFYYIVMDYVEGFPLTRVLEEGPFDRRERIRIVNRVLLDAMFGLSAAHNLCGDDGTPLGIVHRDVSPQNILIGMDGVGRLTDFGVAFAASRITASRPGMIKGKPSYLSPEQATAEPIDARADLWALGVILWEALTGVRLFGGETEAATVLKVVSDPIPSPATLYADLPADIEALCMRALERDPRQRHGSARDMALELEQSALRSGLLADPHEVADLMRDRFGEEVEMQRRAIQRIIASIGSATEPASITDVYALPKLGDDGQPILLTSEKGALGPSAAAEVSVLPWNPKLMPTTSSGTATENSGVTPRRWTGAAVLLLLLFGLGSLTTLFLLRSQSFVERTRGFGMLSGSLPPAEVAKPAIEPQATSESRRLAELLASAPEPQPAPSAQASERAREAAASQPSMPRARAAPARGLDDAPSQSARRSAPARVTGPASAAPDAIPAQPAKKAGAAGLPIEENPYRLQ